MDTTKTKKTETEKETGTGTETETETGTGTGTETGTGTGTGTDDIIIDDEMPPPIPYRIFKNKNKNKNDNNNNDIENGKNNNNNNSSVRFLKDQKLNDDDETKAENENQNGNNENHYHRKNHMIHQNFVSSLGDIYDSSRYDCNTMDNKSNKSMNMNNNDNNDDVVGTIINAQNMLQEQIAGKSEFKDLDIQLALEVKKKKKRKNNNNKCCFLPNFCNNMNSNNLNHNSNHSYNNNYDNDHDHDEVSSTISGNCSKLYIDQIRQQPLTDYLALFNNNKSSNAGITGSRGNSTVESDSIYPISKLHRFNTLDLQEHIRKDRKQLYILSKRKVYLYGISVCVFTIILFILLYMLYIYGLVMELPDVTVTELHVEKVTMSNVTFDTSVIYNTTVSIYNKNAFDIYCGKANFNVYSKNEAGLIDTVSMPKYLLKPEQTRVMELPHLSMIHLQEKKGGQDIIQQYFHQEISTFILKGVFTTHILAFGFLPVPFDVRLRCSLLVNWKADDIYSNCFLDKLVFE